MVVAFDNTFLNALFNVKAGLKPYQRHVRNLVNQIEEGEGTIIIPMPVWAELLVGLRVNVNPQNYKNVVKEISESPYFQIVPFDKKSAELLIEATYVAHSAGDKKGGVEDGWQKVKFDRQIVAIAKAHGVEILYTNDRSQANFAKHEFGLEVKNLESLR